MLQKPISAIRMEAPIRRDCLIARTFFFLTFPLPLPLFFSIMAGQRTIEKDNQRGELFSYYLQMGLCTKCGFLGALTQWQTLLPFINQLHR